MNELTFILRPDNARDRMAAAWNRACEYLQHDKQVRVTVAECKPTRTLEQNAKLWAMLTDIARQVKWFVDGEMKYLEPEDWKDILTAGLRKNQHIAQGIEGGFVMLGQRTSKMTIGQMVELIEFAYWFGSREETKVIWSDSDIARIQSARGEGLTQEVCDEYDRMVVGGGK